MDYSTRQQLRNLLTYQRLVLRQFRLLLEEGDTAFVIQELATLEEDLEGLLAASGWEGLH